MKILTQINYKEGLGADRWISEGYQAAFENLGHEFYYLTFDEDLTQKLEEIRPDITLLSIDRLTTENMPGIHAARERGMKLAVTVDTLFKERHRGATEIIINEDPADLYYSDVEEAYMSGFERETGKKYHVMPNAAHHKRHFPTEQVDKYKCDVVFLGALTPNKKDMLLKLVVPLKRKYDVRIYGPMWTAKDNSMRAAAYGARRLGLIRLNSWISKKRLQIPIEDENKLYSSAKICLNVHERGEHIKDHIILNERTFKIPACGGFEMMDFVPELRNYFSEDEMVMADDRNGDWIKDWFDKIEYYLKHEDERLAIQQRGVERALKDHLYTNRARRLLQLLGI